MRSCLIVGDCIALGVAAAINTMAPIGCEVRARVGATTNAIAALVSTKRYDIAIVSAGSNDAAGRNLDRDLAALRRRLNAASVNWIYPRSQPRAWSVYRVALRHGDHALGLRSLASRDDVHPRDYRRAARLIVDRVFPSVATKERPGRQTVRVMASD